MYSGICGDCIGINNLVVGQDTADDTLKVSSPLRKRPAGSSLIQRLSCWDFSLPERSRAVQSVNSATAFINCWARIPSELRSVTQILQAGFLTKMERFVTDLQRRLYSLHRQRLCLCSLTSDTVDEITLKENKVMKPLSNVA